MSETENNLYGVTVEMVQEDVFALLTRGVPMRVHGHGLALLDTQMCQMDVGIPDGDPRLRRIKYGRKRVTPLREGQAIESLVSAARQWLATHDRPDYSDYFDIPHFLPAHKFDSWKVGRKVRGSETQEDASPKVTSLQAVQDDFVERYLVDALGNDDFDRLAILRKDRAGECKPLFGNGLLCGNVQGVCSGRYQSTAKLSGFQVDCSAIQNVADVQFPEIFLRFPHNAEHHSLKSHFLWPLYGRRYSGTTRRTIPVDGMCFARLNFEVFSLHHDVVANRFHTDQFLAKDLVVSGSH